MGTGQWYFLREGVSPPQGGARGSQGEVQCREKTTDETYSRQVNFRYMLDEIG